jgi:hypothetical protein
VAYGSESAARGRRACDTARSRGGRQPRADALVALVAALGVVATLATPAPAAPPADTMPYRVVHGRPAFTPEGAITCFLWSEGGRLHLRVRPNGAAHRVRGELRTSRDGFFRDVTPLSEDLLVKQSKPSKIEFETHTAAKEEGLDVTLAGDFNQVTIDLTVDGVRAPDALRIGARSATPRGLPVRLDVKGADPSWIPRFGF